MERRGFLKLIAAAPVALAIKPEKHKPKELTLRDKQRIIGEMLRTSEGRNKLAAAMAQPLKERTNYESFSRRILQVSPM